MRIAPDSKTLIGLPPGPSGIDDRRYAVVGADLEEVGVELLTLRDIDRMDGVGQAHFLERDRDLAPVWGAPGVKFDGHVTASPVVAAGSIAAHRKPVQPSSFYQMAPAFCSSCLDLLLSRLLIRRVGRGSRWPREIER